MEPYETRWSRQRSNRIQVLGELCSRVATVATTDLLPLVRPIARQARAASVLRGAECPLTPWKTRRYRGVTQGFSSRAAIALPALVIPASHGREAAPIRPLAEDRDLFRRVGRAPDADLRRTRGACPADAVPSPPRPNDGKPRYRCDPCRRRRRPAGQYGQGRDYRLPILGSRAAILAASSFHEQAPGTARARLALERSGGECWWS